MKKYFFSFMLIILLLLVSGCSGGGTPPVLTFDDVDIVLGESKLYNLTGFTYNLTGASITYGELPAKAWVSDSLWVEKDKKTYASVNIYNPNSEKKNLSLCTIFNVNISMQSEDKSGWAKNNVIVNGIDFFGMDSTAVKEVMSDYKLKNETQLGTLLYKDGDYKYSFRFDDDTGLVKEVSVEMVIAKSYTSY